MSFGISHKSFMMVNIRMGKKLEIGLFFIWKIEKKNLNRCNYKIKILVEEDHTMKQIQLKLGSG